MKMTIDNSICLLEDYLEWQKLHKLDGTGIDEATRNLIDVARKYQKIAQILKDIPYGGEATVRRIQEVIEDGNDTK